LKNYSSNKSYTEDISPDILPPELEGTSWGEKLRLKQVLRDKEAALEEMHKKMYPNNKASYKDFNEMTVFCRH
jgi:hypothetical protein